MGKKFSHIIPLVLMGTGLIVLGVVAAVSPVEWWKLFH